MHTFRVISFELRLCHLSCFQIFMIFYLKKNKFTYFSLMDYSKFQIKFINSLDSKADRPLMALSSLES